MVFPVRPSDKEAKGRMAINGYSSGCDNGAHRHSETGIHQLLAGLAETVATVHLLLRELHRRGQEALVVRLNFVFFTDSVSELYGQRMYFSLHTYYFFSYPHIFNNKTTYLLLCLGNPHCFVHVPSI
jgi:hypothetical protein